jgi:SAM-dependent methyltransferase
MRVQILDFARDVVDLLGPPAEGPVIELGARAAEGQEESGSARSLFTGVEYIGCDLQEGPGVDRLEDIHALTFADGSVGAVVCLDTLEHVRDPIRAVAELHRVLRPGGYLIMTSVMIFPIHAHPWDYWRFTPEGFAALLEPFDGQLVAAHGSDLMPETVFGLGLKAGDGARTSVSIEELRRTNSRIVGWGHGRPVELGQLRFTVGETWAFAARSTLDAARRRLRR